MTLVIHVVLDARLNHGLGHVHIEVLGVSVGYGHGLAREVDDEEPQQTCRCTCDPATRDPCQLGTSVGVGLDGQTTPEMIAGRLFCAGNIAELLVVRGAHGLLVEGTEHGDRAEGSEETEHADRNQHAVATQHCSACLD